MIESHVTEEMVIKSLKGKGIETEVLDEHALLKAADVRLHSLRLIVPIL
jgi:hypothetical protein